MEEARSSRTNQRPLAKRKKQLFKLTRRTSGIEYAKHLTGHGPTVFKHACGLGSKAS